jgi:hypothetical protein
MHTGFVIKAESEASEGILRPLKILRHSFQDMKKRYCPESFLMAVDSECDIAHVKMAIGANICLV